MTSTKSVYNYIGKIEMHHTSGICHIFSWANFEIRIGLSLMKLSVAHFRSSSECSKVYTYQDPDTRYGDRDQFLHI